MQCDLLRERSKFFYSEKSRKLTFSNQFLPSEIVGASKICNSHIKLLTDEAWAKSQGLVAFAWLL